MYKIISTNLRLLVIIKILYMTTKKERRERRERKRTQRRTKGSSSNSDKVKLIKYFMELLNMIKLFHWKTGSYSTHKATDKLHEKLSGHIDKYVEILMGKHDLKLNMKDFTTIRLENIENKKSLKTYINKVKKEILKTHTELETGSPNKNVDLLAIRDEIIGDLNRFLYLIRLN